jgi:hypothetical protein
LAVTSFTNFPDLETAVMDLLVGLAPTGTVTPPNLNTSLPFIRVMRIGGGDTRFVDTAHIDVDAFGATREAAYALAEACREVLLGFPYVTSAGVIDSVQTDSGPHEIPWGNSNVRRLTSSYSITARR